MPSKAITIPLRAIESSLYDGEIKDERCVGASRWLLEIRSPIGEADLIVRVPQLVKVCSSRFVVELVKRALPGLGLDHLPRRRLKWPSKWKANIFPSTGPGRAGTTSCRPAGLACMFRARSRRLR